MSDIRTIYLEIVRSGPSHNQLLSPLTHYLALCGDFPAADLAVPQEHRHFMRRLRELQYTGAKDQDSEERRRSALDELGQEMAQLLRQVPGLAAGLATARHDQVALTHLQLVLSAAELALLPFELSAVPWGCPGGEKNRLMLQNEAPVCITRQVRGTSHNHAPWPRRPKILFVAAAPEGLTIPLKQHTEALLASILPWVDLDEEKDQGTSGIRTAVGDVLTILPNATIYDVVDACRHTAYTHVHVLAHGVQDDNSEGGEIGLAMPSRSGGIDIVTGERFATALKTASAKKGGPPASLPAVVTLATCRAGEIKDVIYTGASFAHELHEAGVPLVVASQFPLSFTGSIHLVEVLYPKLLWGEDPRFAIHTLRRKLYALHSADTHDWASLVAYTALPHTLETELEHTRYHQARAAIGVALGRLDDELRRIDEEIHVGPISPGMDAGPASLPDEVGKTEPEETRDTAQCRKAVEAGLKKVDRAVKYLPTDGLYSTEGNGLLGATEKRKAEIWFKYARCVGDSAKDYRDALEKCHQALRLSRGFYAKAIQGSLQTSRDTPQIKTSRHWVLVQYLCLGTVMGEDLLVDHWQAARVAAEADLSADASTQAEAHSSLAELYLLLLAHLPETASPTDERPNETGSQARRRLQPFVMEPAEAERKAEEHIKAMIALATASDYPFIIYATGRQFRRYYEWWDTPQFKEFVTSRAERHQRSWAESGLNQLAARLATMCLSGA